LGIVAYLEDELDGDAAPRSPTPRSPHSQVAEGRRDLGSTAADGLVSDRGGRARLRHGGDFPLPRRSLSLPRLDLGLNDFGRNDPVGPMWAS
jgi:hypothetical protein